MAPRIERGANRGGRGINRRRVHERSRRIVNDRRGRGFHCGGERCVDRGHVRRGRRTNKRGRSPNSDQKKRSRDQSDASSSRS